MAEEVGTEGSYGPEKGVVGENSQRCKGSLCIQAAKITFNGTGDWTGRW